MNLKLTPKIFRRILAAAAIVCVVVANCLTASAPKKDEPSNSRIAALVSGAAKAEKRLHPAPHWALLSESDALMGIVVDTAEIDPKVNGYGGEISALVALSTEGEILAMEPLRHDETPFYFGMVAQSGFFAKFAGRRIDGGLQGLDAVTGATVTSEAIMRDALMSSRNAFNAIFKSSYPVESAASARFALDGLPVAAAAAALALLAQFRRSSRLRAVSLAAGFFGVGVYLNASPGFSTLAQILSLNAAVLNNAAAAGLFVFAVVCALLGRRTWCEFACPFGATQEAVSRVSPIRIIPSQRALASAANIRHVIAAAMLILFFAFDVKSAPAVEPFSLAFSRSSGLIAWAFVASALLLGAFFPRAWCRIFCPTGLFLEILTGAKRALTRRRSENNDARKAENEQEAN